MRRLEIIRIHGTEHRVATDLVTEEIPLRLLAGHRRLAVLMCSPGDLEDLVRGFFYTNGFIQRAEQIRRIVINRGTWSAFIELDPEIDPDRLTLSGVIGSACGSYPTAESTVKEERQKEELRERSFLEGRRREADVTVSSGRISGLMEEFRRRSEVHRQTGGVHAAALSDRRGTFVFREDIGRHNAVDKAIGACLLDEQSFEEKILITSGRLSSEILHKAAACGLPVVVSRSAPTDRSVALAQKKHITLVGFARGGRMNVYSAAERIFVDGY
jgi:FdhD protein